MAFTKTVVTSVLLLLAAVTVMAQEQERRLIELQPYVRVWMTEDEILNLTTKNVGFVDVTDHRKVVQAAPRKNKLAIPTDPTQQAQVNTLVSELSLETVQTNLNTFSSFNNRYYTASSGEQSSNWLFQMVQLYASNRSDITVTQFTHSWLQKSVIARIEGRGGSDEIVIIGSHQDSINSLSPVNGRAPGADDDGSGSMTILEVFRVIASSGYIPQLTIEFQWYSAEEVGLRGSNDIAAAYVRDGVAVRSMMQIDMDAYTELNEIAIITDYTDATLNAFIRKLIETYTARPWVNSICGYGCSDHASWTARGIPAAFPFEQQFSNINPFIHTANDDVTKIDWTQVYEFLKLGTGYVVELSTL